jgi:Cu2+-exporting ATPase
VVLYSSSIFFTGAWRALRARTLDMMVLVAVAVGIAFVYSAAVTFGPSGETFYDAAAMLATFVLLGTGLRCVPAAAPTTRSERCSTSPRRERS